MHALVAAGLYLGLRKGELFGLRWIDIHLEGAARVDVMKSYAGSAPTISRPKCSA